MKISVSHPGRLGDALYCLPTVRHLSKIFDTKIDFWTSNYCKPLVNLLKKQTYINEVFINEQYIAHHHNCGTQPSILECLGKYDKIFHLGIREYPQCRLVDYYPTIHGFTMVDTTIKYDFPPLVGGSKDRIIVCPGRNTVFKPLLTELMTSLADEYNPVYQIGPKEECISIDSPSVLTYNVDMLETLSYMSDAKLFIGTLSANLVLANGFPDLKKVILCEPERWCPRHDIHTVNHHYIVPSSLEQVLSLCE